MNDDAFRQTQRSDTNVYAFRHLKWGFPKTRNTDGSGGRFWVVALITAALGFGAVYAATSPDHGASVAQAALGQFGLVGCNIKGNISISSGERIYHVPGQYYYTDTTIRRDYGERWFCSEAEARHAGWRKSGI